MKNPYHVVDTLLVTEKGTELADDLNQYVFKVANNANKIEIKNAVESLFDVTVSSVNVMKYSGKRKRRRSLHYGKRPDWKKAVVTVSEGSIELV